VFSDLKRDLALVELDQLPPDTPALPLAATSPRVGDELIQIGNFGQVTTTFSVIKGTVRAVEITDFVIGGSDEKLRLKAKMVRVTNPVGPVATAGPWIDIRGHQVAVAESANFGIAAQNLLAIDVTEVRAFLTENKAELSEPKADPAPKK
jgi:hypothetical protein